MKPRISSSPEAGLNLFEVGVVLAVVMILAVVILPALQPSRKKRDPYFCVNNLKQVGLAYRVWSGDHGDIYPMALSVTNGGSMEMVATGNVVQTYMVMSNALGTPKVLFCPANAVWLAANGFSGLANSNVSYFINVDGTDTDPEIIISGDSSFELRGKPVNPGLLALWTNDPVAWSVKPHNRAGNLLFADGSVGSVTTRDLQNVLKQTERLAYALPAVTNRWAIP